MVPSSKRVVAEFTILRESVLPVFGWVEDEPLKFTVYEDRGRQFVELPPDRAELAQFMTQVPVGRWIRNLLSRLKVSRFEPINGSQILFEDGGRKKVVTIQGGTLNGRSIQL